MCPKPRQNASWKGKAAPFLGEGIVDAKCVKEQESGLFCRGVSATLQAHRR
jgi:hypothetical protein